MSRLTIEHIQPQVQNFKYWLDEIFPKESSGQYIRHIPYDAACRTRQCAGRTLIIPSQEHGAVEIGLRLQLTDHAAGCGQLAIASAERRAGSKMRAAPADGLSLGSITEIKSAKHILRVSRASHDYSICISDSIESEATTINPQGNSRTQMARSESTTYPEGTEAVTRIFSGMQLEVTYALGRRAFVI